MLSFGNTGRISSWNAGTQAVYPDNLPSAATASSRRGRLCVHRAGTSITIAPMPAETISIDEAAAMLKRGDVVAMPTETVYGLAVNATNADAVAKVFALKGRPATNPLIVHVPDINAAKAVTASWPKEAQSLAAAFWPGALTLVLPKAQHIASQVTAGLESIAVRVPSHPLAIELLRAVQLPLAAPSANRSEHISPTSAEHVRAEFGDSVPILDGGPCELGIESTVVSLLERTPTVLRPGGVNEAQLRKVLGGVLRDRGSDEPDMASESPGRGARHYAPRMPAYRFESSQMSRLMRSRSTPAAVMVIGKPIARPIKGHVLKAMPSEPIEYAQRFYAALRELEAENVAEIWIELPPGGEQWNAVRDRITRATEAIEASQ